MMRKKPTTKGIMDAKLERYFWERYQAENFRVVPGHWPDFKSKEEIDEWLESMHRQAERIEEYFREKERAKAAVAQGMSLNDPARQEPCPGK